MLIVALVVAFKASRRARSSGASRCRSPARRSRKGARPPTSSRGSRIAYPWSGSTSKWTRLSSCAAWCSRLRRASRPGSGSAAACSTACARKNNGPRHLRRVRGHPGWRGAPGQGGGRQAGADGSPDGGTAGRDGCLRNGTDASGTGRIPPGRTACLRDGPDACGTDGEAARTSRPGAGRFSGRRTAARWPVLERAARSRFPTRPCRRPRSRSLSWRPGARGARRRPRSTSRGRRRA